MGGLRDARLHRVYALYNQGSFYRCLVSFCNAFNCSYYRIAICVFMEVLLIE